MRGLNFILSSGGSRRTISNGEGTQLDRCLNGSLWPLVSRGADSETQSRAQEIYQGCFWNPRLEQGCEVGRIGRPEKTDCDAFQ